MLVLTRKLGEGIAIGDDIKIIVMQIKGKQVRLGIKANPNTIVHREEVYRRIQDENRVASQMSREAIGEAAALMGIRRTEKSNLRLKKRFHGKKD
ncbi:MAG: carbon storage regulator CsrA [Deltaproteobacteria bacterium]|nr:carbon storage regulator CsrA [Deltaproteobacteria bacterium]